MKFRSFTMAAAIFAAGLFSAGTALAQNAEATTAVNVRSGPSTSYHVVDTLYAGEDVNISRCSGGWCQITHSGPDGWVSDNYLRPIRGGATVRGGNSNGNANAPDIGFCIQGENFQFGINCDPNANDNNRRDRGRGRDRGRADRNYAEVCFYEDYGYRGASFCARPGDRDRSLSQRWNDRISSIRIRGNASAVVCEDFNYGGRCARVDNSIRALRGRNNDIISSYRIR